MKLTLEALEAIDAIERCGSYAAAAEELNKVPSALTYIVQKLESDLGVTLFDRTGHRAKLTDTGNMLLRRGRHLLRDARDLECRARRVNAGWEGDLRIGLDTIVPFAAMVPYISAFYAATKATRLSFSHEVLGGTWDALHSRRVDLVIGAMGEPPHAGIEVQAIGTLDMVFCAGPGHPLAAAPEPLDPREVARHRAIAIADTSRQLLPRSSGIFEGQETIAVACLDAKVRLQLAGLGTGYLPLCVARRFIERGELIAKDLATPAPSQTFYLAWHADHAGEALSWWLRNLSHPNILSDMWRANEQSQ